MTRKKVKLAFVESNTKRKNSYKKRHKGFLKKAEELSTLCDVETATIVYSPYHNEPKVFPNHDDVKFRELSELEQSKNMATLAEFTRQRIKKLEQQLRKVRKENRVKEFTNKMHEVLNGKDIPADMHPYDLNDLSYVINQNLKRVREAMKAKADEEGSTSNAPQPIVGPVVPGGTSSEGPRTPLLDPPVAPISMVPCGINFEGPRTSLLAPAVAPLFVVPPSMVPSVASAPNQVPQPMFQSVAPLAAPLVGPSRVPPPPSPPFSSKMSPPMVPQLYPPIPQQMALRRAPAVAPPMPSPMIGPPMPPPIMASPMPSPMMTPPVSAPVFDTIK
ncbi:hypothetical protein RND71_041095 [Anisodus tanguticus]|uniref:MADS-box domain-containing protein n=1 Tax=Anisodus tanguticus TaxID=243964 RepID=A0AAE1QV55_9SOLA|nr:hypothetical protein RND71_041095 [Anisodus tanguticus]